MFETVQKQSNDHDKANNLQGNSDSSRKNRIPLLNKLPTYNLDSDTSNKIHTQCISKNNYQKCAYYDKNLTNCCQQAQQYQQAL